jgi:hypothetical protein
MPGITAIPLLARVITNMPAFMHGILQQCNVYFFHLALMSSVNGKNTIVAVPCLIKILLLGVQSW